jgi:hypothetical protein
MCRRPCPEAARHQVDLPPEQMEIGKIDVMLARHRAANRLTNNIVG